MKYVSAMGLNIWDSLVDMPTEAGVKYISVKVLIRASVAEWSSERDGKIFTQ
jgi:hypothetical protein